MFKNELIKMQNKDHMLNVRIPADLASQLDALTKATGRTKSYLATNALNNYVNAELWQIHDIQKGLEEANARQFATEDDENNIDFFFKRPC